MEWPKERETESIPWAAVVDEGEGGGEEALFAYKVKKCALGSSALFPAPAAVPVHIVAHKGQSTVPLRLLLEKKQEQTLFKDLQHCKDIEEERDQAINRVILLKAEIMNAKKD